MQLPPLLYWWDFSHISAAAGRQAMAFRILGGVGGENTQKTEKFLIFRFLH